MIDIKEQKELHKQADLKRFYWHIKNPYIYNRDKELLSNISIDTNNNIKIFVEVGAGEGSNIYTLQDIYKSAKINWIAVDYSYEKLLFLNNNVSNVLSVCADANNLPFKKNTIDYILMRNLLHHLFDPIPTLNESSNILKKNGELYIYEGNYKNIVSKIYVMFFSFEKGMKKTVSIIDNYFKKSTKSFKKIIKIDLDSTNIFLALFNYRFFYHKIMNFNFMIILLKLIDKVLIKIFPQKMVAYILFIIEKQD